jgi:phospholipid/cholesterol/gamma-HCH transport system substrate-binding protein
VKSKELKVGIFSAIVLVLLYFGFDFLKGRDFFQTTTKYYAIYDNIDELTKSSAVLVNGFAVGRVSNIRIMQENHNKVLVELEIDSDIDLGDSTKAVLDSDFLGTKSIRLDIGTVVTPLEPRDTVIAVLAQSVIDMITASAEPVAADLQTTLRKLNTVLDNLANNSQALDTIFDNLKRTPILLNNTIAKSDAKIDSLTDAFIVTSRHLNETMAALRPTLRNMQVFSDSLKRIELNQTLEKTQKAITDFNTIIARLDDGDNTASKLLTEDSLYVNLNHLLVSFDSLARHFDSSPRDFLKPLGKSQKKLDKERADRKKK